METVERARPVLDPIDRMSEIIFGLLMALSFTGTMSAAVAGGQQVSSVLMAALGCNIAWGIVDGVMFVLASAVERARRLGFLASIRTLPMPEARRAFFENVQEDVRHLVTEKDVDALLTRMRGVPAPGHQRIVNASDLLAALSIFALVVLSTLPPSLPFLFIDDLRFAMRVSNAVALVMLFAIGAQLGSYMGRRPWPMAFAMASIGAVLVAITVALGG